MDKNKVGDFSYMIKATVLYVGIGLDGVHEELDRRRTCNKEGSLCKELPELDFEGYELATKSYKNKDLIEEGSCYIRYYQKVEDIAVSGKVDKDGVLKRTKYVRVVNGVGLVVAPTEKGYFFTKPKDLNGLTLVSVETQGLERTYHYEKDDTVKREDILPLELDRYEDEVLAFGQLNVELTHALRKDLQAVYKKEDVSESLEVKGPVVEGIVDDANKFKDRVKEKLGNVGKEQVIALGFVTSVVLVNLARRIFKK